MKKAGAVMVMLGVFFTIISNGKAEEISAGISHIEKNVSIEGKVFGLAQVQFVQFCVVVYVHTDTWYIHPYANGGDKKSWASIRNDGTWSIATIQRDFPADSIATLVLKRQADQECDAPAKVDSPMSINDRIGRVTVTNLKGTADFGKL